MKTSAWPVALCSLTLFSCSEPAQELSTKEQTLLNDASHAVDLFERLSSLQPGDAVELPTSGSVIRVRVETFYFEDGYLSLTGSVDDSEGSSFMLKGRSTSLSGFLTLDDEAYRYSTNEAAELVVEAVTVEAIFPDCGHGPGVHGESHHTPRQFAPVAAGDRIAPFVGQYGGEDLLSLESRPGAPKVLYLNINAVIQNGEPLHTTKEGMWEIWQIVAAGFASFDVNVTTSESVYEAAGLENSGFAVFSAADIRGSCCVDCFGTQDSCTMGRIYSPYDSGRGALHEFGHLLGLGHDGIKYANEYFDGFDDFKWVPIMGYYHSGTDWGEEALYQWSKGEYELPWDQIAHNKEDDLAIISAYLPYQEDDIGESGKALNITGDGEVLAEENFGSIETNTDSDVFRFALESENPVELNVFRQGHIGGAMLDIQATLIDSTGSVIAEDNPTPERGASFELTLDAGEYTLVVEGGAEGTPKTGFSNYSSIGLYSIQGTINGSTEPTDTGTGGSGGEEPPEGSGGSTTGSGGSASGGSGATPPSTDPPPTTPTPTPDVPVTEPGAPPAPTTFPEDQGAAPSPTTQEEAGCSCDLSPNRGSSPVSGWLLILGMMGALSRRLITGSLTRV